MRTLICKMLSPLYGEDRGGWETWAVIRPSSTLTEVAFSVCTALHKAGYTVVMTGGSAATFYAPRAHLSADIDFVIALKGTDGEEALEHLGYQRKADYRPGPLRPFPAPGICLK